MTEIVPAIAMSFAVLSGAAADEPASLTPTPRRDATVWPYRAAELAVNNDSDRIVRAVAVRWVAGGPTMVYPATIPPRSGRTIPVSVPAVASEQWYRVRLLAEDRAGAEALAAFEAAVSWPPRADETTDDDYGQAFIDPDACDRFAFDLPQWPGRSRANVMVAAAVAALAMAAVLFVRRRTVRMVLLAATVAAATTFIWKVVLPRETIVTRVLSSGSDLPVYAAAQGDRLYVVAARRTSQWTHPDARLAPIYYDRFQMAEDTMVVHANRGISVRLRPGVVRLFRLRR